MLAILSLPAMLPFITIVREQIVRWEMKEALEEKELITIYADPTKIIWEEEGKECRINGSLFDVKEIEKINGQYKLKGLYDTREKEIEEQLANMAGKQNDQQASAISKIFNLRYLNNEASSLPAKIFTIVELKLFVDYNDNYHHPYLSMTNPPPEWMYK